MRPYLDILATTDKDAQSALLNPPLDWLSWFQAAAQQFCCWNQQACAACNNRLCSAWIAFKCGLCNRLFWANQLLIVELLCRRCLSEVLRRRDWADAFERESGISIDRWQEVYDSPEQIILAWMRWEFRFLLWKRHILTNSHIVKAKCCSKVPLKDARWIGPIRQGQDPEQVLQNQIDNLRRLSIGKHYKKK